MILLRQMHKKSDICQYWYFKDIGFKYKPYLYNGCHDLMQKAMDLNDVTILSIKRSDYRIYFWYMSKDDAINLEENSNLNEKVDYYKFFLLYIKIGEKTYYPKAEKKC